MTQQQVADKVHRCRETYGYWESGRYEPDLDSLARLAQVFTVTVDQLITGDFENTPTATVRCSLENQGL